MNKKVKANCGRGYESELVDKYILDIEQKKGNIWLDNMWAEDLGQIGSEKAINYLISLLEKRPAAARALRIEDILHELGGKALPQYKHYLNTHMRPGEEGASKSILDLMKYCEDEGFFLYLIALYKNPNLSDSIKTYITEHDMAYKDLYSHEDVQALIELIPSEDQDNPDWQLHCAIMRRVEKGTHKELRPLYEAILRTTNPYWIDFRQDALDAIEDINQPPWD